MYETTRAIMTACIVCFAAGAAFAAEDLVSQKGKTFAPDELSEAAGMTLRITNDDDVSHNIIVTAPGGSPKNLGVQKPGDSVSVPLDQTGDYMIRCGIHPKMKLAVHAH